MRTLSFLTCLLAATPALAQDYGEPPPPAPASSPAEPVPPVPTPTTEPAPVAPPVASAPAEAYTEPMFELPAATGAAALGDGAYELSEADLAKLGFMTEEEGELTIERPIEISGFMDAGLFIPLGPMPKQLFGRNASIYMGNVNIYISKQISDTVRTLAEIRFLLLPNGDTSTGERINTAVADYQDFYRPLRWGGVELERVYLEWAAYSWFNLRAGIFLTPYGIWNVDHGSPTIIPVTRPFAIGNGYFPERQTGIEVFGTHDMSGTETVGYHFTLSNGTGPIAEYLDLDRNKAIGGRLYFETRRVGELRLGSSFYYGRQTDSFIANPFVSQTPSFTSQYNDLAFGLDLLFKWENLHVQGEWILRERAYTNAGRVAITGFGPAFIPSDLYSWALYGLVGYRLPLLGIMPFVMAQTMRGVGTYVFELNLNAIHFGLNVRPLDELVFKVDYSYSHSVTGNAGFADDDLNLICAQVAWAF